MSVEQRIQVAVVKADMFIESALPLIRTILISFVAVIAVMMWFTIMERRRNRGEKKKHHD